MTDVLDSPLVVMSEALLSDPDCEIVEPQSFSSPESVKRSVWRIKKT